MKLADRIAAWFGYVPRENLVPAEVYRGVRRATCSYCGTDCGPVQKDDIVWMCECRRTHLVTEPPLTLTMVKPRPEILVSADFKRGIPCS